MAVVADNLLVLYVPDQAAVDDTVARLASLGYRPVAPANPYWDGRSVTVADPDGWRVVLFTGAGLDGG